MKLLTTLLLICSTMFVQAQEPATENVVATTNEVVTVEASQDVIAATEIVPASAIAEFDDDFGEPEKMS